MRTLFELSDNTETFKVIFYKKAENEPPKALKDLEYQENQWIRVMGTVRVFKEQTAIIGNHVTIIKDHNEITNHFLQVFVAHNVRKKGVLSQDQLRSGRGQKVQAQGPSVDLLQLMKQMMQRNSMRFIAKESIMQECRGRLSQTEIDNQLKFLIEDGSIYPAGNDNVFSLTDMD